MMDYLDFLVDGVKVCETDLTKFVTETQLRAWRKRVVQTFEVVSGDPSLYSEGRIVVIDGLNTLTRQAVTMIRSATEARKMGMPPRNLDLVVIAGNNDRAETMNYNIGHATAQEVLDVRFAMFDRAEQMTAYEFDAYDTLGEDECDKQGIETLYDMFGADFAVPFFRRKNLLIAHGALAEAEAELKAAQDRVDELRAIIKHG